MVACDRHSPAATLCHCRIWDMVRSDSGWAQGLFAACLHSAFLLLSLNCSFNCLPPHICIMQHSKNSCSFLFDGGG